MTRTIVASMVLALAACGSGPSQEASGAEIYAQLCARCHGPDLGGGIGPALDSGSDAAERSDEYLETTIIRGKGSRMPSFGNALSEEQVQRLVAHLREMQG